MSIRDGHLVPHLPDPQEGKGFSMEAARRQAAVVCLLGSFIPFIFLSFLILSSPKTYLRIPVEVRSKDLGKFEIKIR